MPVLILNHDNQAILISLHVEYDAIIGNETGVAVDRFNLRRRFPAGSFHVGVPGLQ